ncbi:hypothetical protein MOBT1_001659 [Malassezia obtusa]|uniref:Endoplasmic reticulum membrane protein C16E8.02 n=1 Tax=Malassezia obtusa TaxID=76774 RepID=A0AAF0E0J9_9BASI|nr:hypothetical protein MOBT1_001659 [Malassezia obtusa]
MGLSADPLSLRDQLAFYGAYHTNTVNVFIHIVCVPLIWMTALALVLTSGFSLHGAAMHLPAVLQAPVLEVDTLLVKHTPSVVYQHLNIASFVALAYLIYYAVLDVAAAALISPLWAAYYLAAWAFVEHYPHAQLISLAVFIASWIAQFYGHGVHEGRAPALLDNLLGAVVLAPLFVFLEVLFFFGYRPELQKWLKNETGKMITEFRLQQAQRERAQANKSK